jgi:protein-S-isoprenylcysteine O-methyltransferase Ste14
MWSPKMSNMDVVWHIRLILGLFALFLGTLVSYPLVRRNFKKSSAFRWWLLLLAGLALSILYMFLAGLGANGFLD